MDLVLVDDHPAVRAGLRGLLEDEDDLRVAATAATAREGYEAIVDLRPALAVLDHHLPDDDGLSLCLRTRTLPAPPRAVIYSAYADAGLAVQAAIAGADAVVAKSTPPQRLVSALRAVGGGRGGGGACGGGGGGGGGGTPPRPPGARGANGWPRTPCRSSACSPTVSPRTR